MKTEKQKIGGIGEDIAVRFLVKHDYKLIQRNFLRKVGEIDIICEKDGRLYFVEVKTVSREICRAVETDEYRAEDNLHHNKIIRMGRAIEVYLEERAVDCDWEILGVMVTLDEVRKLAKVHLLEDFAW